MTEDLRGQSVFADPSGSVTDLSSRESKGARHLHKLRLPYGLTFPEIPLHELAVAANAPPSNV